MKLGDKIKEIRIEKDLSQSELSRLSKVPQTTISNIETNKCTPSIETFASIAIALGVTVDTLLDQDKPA